MGRMRAVQEAKTTVHCLSECVQLLRMLHVWMRLVIILTG